MQLFQKQVRKQIKETRDLLDRIQRFQKTVPKGSLIITHKQKKIYYKWQYHDENLKYIRKYLSKKEEKQIQLLAQKGYYEKVEPILQKNLKLLENFEKAYCYDKEMQIYESQKTDSRWLYHWKRIVSGGFRHGNRKHMNHAINTRRHCDMKQMQESMYVPSQR